MLTKRRPGIKQNGVGNQGRLLVVHLLGRERGRDKVEIALQAAPSDH